MIRDPSTLVSTAVGARAATSALIPIHVPVAVARRPTLGHVAAVPLGEDPTRRRPLCQRTSRRQGLEPVEELAARLLPLCGPCRARLASLRADLVPTRDERAAYYAAAIITAVGRADPAAREDAITAAIAAGVVAVRGQWIPGSRHEVPLHQLIAIWRDQGQLRAQAEERGQSTSRYRNGYALTGTRR
jgi:hypothetical protein